MAEAKQGDTVRVHYTGKLDDGTVFDSSTNREPLEFTIGEGQIIPGFEAVVIGMEPGESRTATIPAAEAYGPHRHEMVMDVDRNQLPPDLEPAPGQQLQVHQEGAPPIMVTVTDVTPDKITLDANHPLAGKDLTFDISLVDIVSV